jgi:hypothetical protein
MPAAEQSITDETGSVADAAAPMGATVDADAPKVVLDRAAIEELAAARSVPAIVNDEIVGFNLYALPPAGHLNALGLEEGARVTAIEGVPVSISRWVELLGAVEDPNLSSLELTLARQARVPVRDTSPPYSSTLAR